MNLFYLYIIIVFDLFSTLLLSYSYILLFIYYFIYLLLIRLAYELGLLEALFNYIFIVI